MINEEEKLKILTEAIFRINDMAGFELLSHEQAIEEIQKIIRDTMIKLGYIK
jgi:hypothetical protein